MKKIFAMIAICLMLAACGVKPSSVEPPGPGGRAFPTTYPTR